jgi:hypothetical protein
MGLKRGSIVNNTKFGLVYIGGTSKGNISFHNLKNGERITKRGHKRDCAFLCYNSWRIFPIIESAHAENN